MDKETFLKETHTYNSKHDRLNDKSFAESEILDARDLLQVRYEMARAVEVDNNPIPEVAARYGVSTSTVRRIIAALKDGGVISLVPDIRGPKGPHRLSEDEIEFIENYLKTSPNASGGKVYRALIENKHSDVSKRTIERYLASKKE